MTKRPTYPSIRYRILLLSMLTFMGMTSVALAQDAPLPVQQQGDARYVTGGIGDDERSALEAVRNDYNLQILNSDADGAFVENTAITIYDRKGVQVLTGTAGPIFYAALPAGKYTVEAVRDGATQKKSVLLVKAHPSKLSMVWK